MATVTTNIPSEPEVTIVLTMREAVALYHVFGNSCPRDTDDSDLPELFEPLDHAVEGYTKKYPYLKLAIQPIED